MFPLLESGTLINNLNSINAASNLHPIFDLLFFNAPFYSWAGETAWVLSALMPSGFEMISSLTERPLQLPVDAITSKQLAVSSSSSIPLDRSRCIAANCQTAHIFLVFLMHIASCYCGTTAQAGRLWSSSSNFSTLLKLTFECMKFSVYEQNICLSGRLQEHGNFVKKTVKVVGTKPKWGCRDVKCFW